MADENVITEEIDNSVDIKDLKTTTLTLREFPSLDYEIDHVDEMSGNEILMTAGIQATKIQYEKLLIKALKNELKSPELKRNSAALNNLNSQIRLREGKMKSREKILEMFSDEYISRFVLTEKDGGSSEEVINNTNE